MSPDSSPATEKAPPWYRQFWPWFIIALPATTVAAGMVTLTLAIRNADPVVVDDWYREGRAINRDLQQDQQAATLGIVARLSSSVVGVEALLTSGYPLPWPDRLALNLRHPTLAERDRSIELEHQGEGRYLAAGEPLPAGDWHLVLASDGWRLSSRRTIHDGAVTLGATAE